MSKPSKVRMAEDATGKRTTYEEIKVGKDLGSFEWSVTNNNIRIFITIFRNASIEQGF